MIMGKRFRAAQEDLRSSKVFLFLFFFLAVADLRSQSDTIYPLNAAKFTATVTEIGENQVRYSLSAGLIKSLPMNKLQKIVLKNGSTEVFNAPLRKDTIKTTLEGDYTHEDIEKIAVEAGKKLVSCAIYDFNASTTVDWSGTQKDYFNPDILTISAKVFYERLSMGIWESQWAIFYIKLNIKTGEKRLIYKNCSNKPDEIRFLKCQKNLWK